MIGLFLPCQRVVSLLKLQRSSRLLGFDGLLRSLPYLFNNGSLAPTRNVQQDGGPNVSSFV